MIDEHNRSVKIVHSTRALVTGATGAIGPILIQQLLETGYQVCALVRRSSLDLFPKEVQTIQGDLTDCESLKQAVKDIDIVFHLAAKLHLNDPSPALRAEYEEVNVVGTQRLAEAAKQAGVSRFIFFSTICVYGPSQPGVIFDESTKPQPDTLYAKTKYSAEQIVLDTLPSTVLRLAAVYGSRMKGNYPRLVKALKQGWFIPIGAGTNRRTLIYEEDVGRAALLAAHHPAAEGEIFNLTDGHIHTFNDIQTAICQALNKQRPRYHLPVTPIRLGLTVVERAFSLIGRRPPVSLALVDKLLEDVAVSGIKIQEQLGFQPQFDLTAGWQASVKGMADSDL